MARSQKQINEKIDEIKRQYAVASDLDAIAKCPEGARLLAVFERSRNFYRDTLASLDENNPVLAKEFAKNKICMKLLDEYIKDMTGAAEVMGLFDKDLLQQNEDLGKAQDELARREKNRM